jgi:predicted nucleotidyltransferase
MDVDGARLHEVNAIVSRARDLAERHAEVRAMVVVGSYAYGQPRMDSDIDLVIAVVERTPG